MLIYVIKQQHTRSHTHRVLVLEQLARVDTTPSIDVGVAIGVDVSVAIAIVGTRCSSAAAAIAAVFIVAAAVVVALCSTVCSAFVLPATGLAVPKIAPTNARARRGRVLDGVLGATLSSFELWFQRRSERRLRRLRWLRRLRRLEEALLQHGVARRRSEAKRLHSIAQGGKSAVAVEKPQPKMNNNNHRETCETLVLRMKRNAECP